jgi:hypothetical protein
MAYTNFTKKSVTKELSTNHLMTQRKMFASSPDTAQFYELEPAVVLDVIRDENHPQFKDKKKCPKIIDSEWPGGYNNKEDPDYSWIGRIKARALFSQNKAPMAELSWVLPLETGIKEFPLVNENVVIVKYLNNVYYTRRINSRNFLNNSADFRTEPRYGANNKLTKKNCPNLVGARNPSNLGSGPNEFGEYLGKYFKANNRVRPLRHFEGDTIIESRFGNSIRFGCYEDNPTIDAGTNQGNGDDYGGNLGNPQILIRNRQRVKYGKEGIYSHTLLEDINADGSSIHITSGKTVSKFIPTLSGPGGGGGGGSQQKKKSNPASQPAVKKSAVKKEPSNFGGLAKVANSSVGTGNVPSSAAVPPSPTQKGQVSPGPMNAMNKSSTGSTGPSAAASQAAKGNWSGSMGASMGTAIGEEDGKLVGDRLGKMGPANASKIVNVQGVSSSSGVGASIGGSVGSSGVGSSSNITHSINSSTGKSKFTKGIGVGNFSLNSTYESGLVGALKKANSVGKSTLLKKTKAGRALSAANSLGIDVDGVKGIGMNSEDSPMFKIFKLASFGLKSICGALKKKKEFGSKTEESLGWLLSFGINLELLALLMAIFERLRNLKFNFGAMFDFGFDLDKLSFDLCDWINQVEFGSNLTDTLTGEASKMFGPLNPKDKVKALGDDLSGKGILNPFAKNDKDFKQQYTSIITEEEKAQLKAAGASFGSMGLSLNKGSDQVATMGFDPLTGLFRNKEQSPFSSNFNFSKANVASVNVAKDAGEINYASFGSGVSFGAAGATGSSGTSGSSGISTGANIDTNQQSDSPLPTDNSTTSRQTPQQPSNNTGSVPARASNQTPSTQSSTQSPTSSQSTNSPTKQTGGITPKTTTTRPSSSDNAQPAQQEPTSVKSFHTGEEITKEQLQGTPIANADLNAVALLHPEDFNTLTDKKAVNDSVKQAKEARKKTLEDELAQVEEKVVSQAAGNLMFGKQLPTLDGNQIIMNSERIIISAKTKEFVTYSKGKYGIATDDEITMNCLQRYVIDTKTHTSVISPTIHLGAYITTRHPVLKGDVTTAWLSSLCGWLSGHVHNDPYITTSTPAQQGQLAGLRARLPTLHSTRVWIDG